jgi:Ca2+-binding EF-hand superfamily protein
MAHFVNENRLKKAVLQFISTQFNLKSEENELRELFKEIDTANRGQISKEEFRTQLM